MRRLQLNSPTFPFSSPDYIALIWQPRAAITLWWVGGAMWTTSFDVGCSSGNMSLLLLLHRGSIVGFQGLIHSIVCGHRHFVATLLLTCAVEHLVLF